jgi:penicillin amidase
MTALLRPLFGLCLVVGAAGPLVATQPVGPAVMQGRVQARVELKLDEAGVAHVFATTRADAAYGLGVLHGENRPHQLDVARRLVHGRLSERVGASGLEHDQLARRLQLVAAARRQLAQLPREERAILTSYARGVNAGRSRSFEPWDPADSLAWALYLAFQLSGNWQTELDRLQLARTLDMADVLLLLPGSASGGAIGSNAWAVGSSSSRSGKPLLANDPHLPLTLPGPWFMARLSVASATQGQRQDVIGATTPGLPVVLIGRTEAVAWGITRNGADTQDLFLEEVDPSDGTRYRTLKGWSAFERHTERIQVKGATAVPVEIERSSRGPIVAEVRPSHRESGEPLQRVALRWAALEGDAASFSAMLRANQASDCPSLMAAFASHVAPAQNVLGADAGGGLERGEPLARMDRGGATAAVERDHPVRGRQPAAGARGRGVARGGVGPAAPSPAHR